MGRTAVIGIGALSGGDGSVGAHAVRLLSRRGFGRDSDLYEAGASVFSSLRVFLEHEYVVVVEAAPRGTRPGVIYRVDADDLDPVAEGVRFPDGLGVPHVVRVARELGARTRVVVIGVQPSSRGSGADLSPEVRAALPKLVDAIADEAGRRAPAAA